jgi:hypothetical protein
MSEASAKAARARSEWTETEAAWKAIRLALTEEWARTGFEQTEKRERLHSAVHLMDGLQAALQRAIDAGLIEDEAEKARQILAEHTTLLRP